MDRGSATGGEWRKPWLPLPGDGEGEGREEIAATLESGLVGGSLEMTGLSGRSASGQEVVLVRDMCLEFGIN